MLSLTDDTVDVLKHIVHVNNNVIFKAGNVLRVVSDSRTMMVRADIVESFPIDWCIGELNKFIMVINGLGGDVKLDFDDKHVTVISADGKARARYFYAASHLIVQPPETDLKIEEVASVPLSKNTLTRIKSVAATMGFDQITFRTTPDLGVEIVAHNVKKRNGNECVIETSARATKEFEVYCNTERLVMPPGDYNVIVDGARCLLWETINYKVPMKYWIAAKIPDDKVKNG